MQQAQRAEAERARYRPEVFEHQRRRAFGLPVDERPISILWCVVPAVFLLLVYGLFAASTYRPRASGTARLVGGSGAVHLSLPEVGEAARRIQPGDEVSFRIGGFPPAYHVTVTRVSDGACRPPDRCTLIEGRVADPTLLPLEAVAVEVLLPARSVVE